MYHQRTLARPVELQGVGLHGGRETRCLVRPADEGTGVVFARTDLAGHESPTVPARIEFLGQANHATILERDGVRVGTVEHLLAALYALGVDNARIELDGEEVPILDGSSAPFVQAIRQAGLVAQEAPRTYLVITRPIEISDGEKQIGVYPCPEYRVTYAIDFEHPRLGFQELTASPWGVDAFARMLAPARTFVLERDVEALRKAGLARGGSLDNAVVVGEEAILNADLRFSDEFVRHKMLDLTGDLALLGHPLRGHVVAFRAGHDMHGLLVRRLLAREDSWYLSAWPEGDPVSEAWSMPRPGSGAGDRALSG